MSVTTKVYYDFFNNIFNFALDGDEIPTKMALLTDGYEPDFYNDYDFEDVSQYEVSGTGYTQGGTPFVIDCYTALPEEGVACFNADAEYWNYDQWENIQVTARYAVMYLDNEYWKGLMVLIDFGENLIINGAFKIIFPDQILFKIKIHDV